MLFPTIQLLENKKLIIGGGGGSRTRVRNRCQPGDSMLSRIQKIRFRRLEPTRNAEN